MVCDEDHDGKGNITAPDRDHVDVAPLDKVVLRSSHLLPGLLVGEDEPEEEEVGGHDDEAAAEDHKLLG